nr:hypothetical protein [Planctomycetota bacterium]
MAKKRSKAKLDTATAMEAVRRKLASGRSMGALQDAKQLVKVDPSDQALALLGDAYAARIQDFVIAGQDSEARDTLAAARAALPRAAERWNKIEAGIALRNGAAMPSAAIDSDVLRRDLTDPRRLATPEAAIVVTALQEACDGKLSAAARDALRGIAADSPLDPWRHFAIAVGAFYEKQDRTAQRALSRIASDAACAPLARVLGAMIEGK